MNPEAKGFSRVEDGFSPAAAACRSSLIGTRLAGHVRHITLVKLSLKPSLLSNFRLKRWQQWADLQVQSGQKLHILATAD